MYGTGLMKNIWTGSMGGSRVRRSDFTSMEDLHDKFVIRLRNEEEFALSKENIDMK